MGEIVSGQNVVTLGEEEGKKILEEYHLPADKKEAVKALARWIWENPELGLEEHQACQRQVDFLRGEGFSVTSPYCGLETAYRAEFTNGGAVSPTFAFCAEYDALPKLGHACGHNLIAGSAVGAALLAKQLMLRESIPGRIVVLGCPAEETSGGKIRMADEGALSDIDALMMAHPVGGDVASHDNGYAGLRTAKIYYYGSGGSGVARCGNPNYVNPLDAQTLLYQAVAFRRHYTPSDVALIGCIPDGGERANMIPVETHSIYTIRSQSRKNLAETAEMLRTMADGAALMTGTKVKFELSGRYEPTLPVYALGDVFLETAKLLGMATRHERGGLNFAATDFGNFAQLRPGVHVHFPTGGKASPHTEGFTESANADVAYGNMSMASTAMASTALKYLRDSAFRRLVAEQFKAAKEA